MADRKTPTKIGAKTNCQQEKKIGANTKGIKDRNRKVGQKTGIFAIPGSVKVAKCT